MVLKLEELKAELAQLSVADLQALQTQINQILQYKTDTVELEPPKVNQPVPDDGKPILPGAFRITLAEVEDSLSKIFTPEELARAAKVDLSKLPPLPKSITEYIDEDREDRF